jgi:hypothetical protein
MLARAKLFESVLTAKDGIRCFLNIDALGLNSQKPR